MKKLLPLIMLLIGAGAGIGAGIFLRPPPQEHAEASEDAQAAHEEEEGEEEEPKFEYVKLNNQFVIPVVNEKHVKALVVMALSVEVPIGQKEAVYSVEPKLRDSFLQVLFNHANVGGFDGEFTSVTNMDRIRKALLEVAQRDVGEEISDVLILEIARQDY